MTNEGILRYNYEPYSLQWHVFHSTKMEMNTNNGRRESLRYGCLVHYCRWCIGIHRGYTSNYTEGKWDCLREGRVPKLAGLPTPWVKEVFILFFSKHKGSVFHAR